MTILHYALIALLLYYPFRGFTLFMIAWLLFPIIALVNYVIVCFKSSPSGYFLSTALNLDKFANREFRTLWNTVLITKDGYKFGHIDETISGVLGKNKRAGTLSKSGIFLANILDAIDENHCIKSIDDLVSWENV